MCAKPKKSEETIYHEAVSKPPEERKAYLEAACGGDAELLARIEALLKARQVKDSFLEVPALDPDITLNESPISEGPGTVIGRYKLLEQIGEGGFGVVYMAEQTKPISRRVALKIIKLGMDTKSVIARFEAERQALAVMDHPNIAKVLDAGATDTGRPYFVMELVKGIPITEYCDKNSLDTRQRLGLFVDVCKAVQHAHQKGIIHRDIKPSNVLITLHDGKPVPKVIDFGIAKATAQRLTEKTLFTRFAQMIGTPEYMSPEQAEFSGLDVDSRSDIYSLGVLLYQLLTGVTPFDAQKLREAGYGEMQRIIREDEPDKPSTRLNTIGEALTDVAKHRKVSPDILAKLLRGDLDLIVMKTLEKDRTRRYERAVELAADVERHLNSKPVLAAPPSMTYRLHKFVRRNRVAVITVFLVAVALAFGTLATTLTFLTSDRLTKEVEQPTPNYHLVLDEQVAGMKIRLCDFSPNGDRIVIKTGDNLYIADQTTTEIRPLLGDLGPWGIGQGRAHWSPNGRLIAYSLSRDPPPDSNALILCNIFTLDPDGGTPRQINRDEVETCIFSVFWTPEGHLSYHTVEGMRTITLDGNEVRFVPREKLVYIGHTGEMLGPGYSPNGRWYVSNRKKENGSGADLCIFPAEGGAIRRITNLPGLNEDPTWGPDGRTVYFVSGEGHASNIWRLPMDSETGLATGDPQQVTFFEDTVIMEPKVLGDGNRIGFQMYRLNTSLQVADSSVPQEAHTLVRCAKSPPELSPDGQIIYYLYDKVGEEGIYAVPRQGGKPRRLIENLPFSGVRSGEEFCPRFDLSPDGSTVVYCTKYGDEQSIFTLLTSGGRPQLLATIKEVKPFTGIVVPQWSPDGSQLAYADGNDLCVIAVAGGQPRKLANTNYGWMGGSVCWSPDGEFIAACGLDKIGVLDVLVVHASGGEPQQLTSDGELKLGLEWHPDGKRLTYYSVNFRTFTRGTYQVYLDGREPSLLFDTSSKWGFVGKWAPDGRRFFFKGRVVSAKQSGMLMGIHVYDESTGETSPISGSANNVCVPSFSRDGTTMAWWEVRETSMQAWIMEDFLPESTAGQ
jgi:serine/threonine protein kinase/Tol biopolymer transport system component